MEVASLISLLVIALVLVVVYYVVGMFITGKPLQIIGLILGLVFLLYALRSFGVLTGVH